MDQVQKSNEELKQIALEIEAAQQAEDLERLNRLQAMYMDVVHSGRQLTHEEMADVIIEYLSETCIATGRTRLELEFEGMCETSDGDIKRAAAHVLMFMLMADMDGQDWGVRRACQEADTAAHRYIELNGNARFI